MKELIGKGIFLSELFVGMFRTIFSVADHGMSDGLHVGTDLMGLPCDQVNLQQCVALCMGNGAIFCHSLRAHAFPFGKANLIFFFILCQIGCDLTGFADFSGHKGQIIFIQLMGTDNLIDRLHASQGFPCNDKAAGVSVQPVA